MNKSNNIRRNKLLRALNTIRKLILYFIYTPIAEFLIERVYGGFFSYKERPKCSKLLLSIYLRKYNATIGEGAIFKSIPRFPHGLCGIHISSAAVIGTECVIFQQVTIGSNTLKSHPRCGAPIIGNNVYIGAGAKIIGKVRIGDNCRIGANCVVVTDMKPNTVAVLPATRFIHKDEIMDNTFISIMDIAMDELEE